MAERYSRLFSLSEQLYVEGAPVFITAGALLKDSVANCVLVQLKFRSLSTKRIKAVVAQIVPKDVAGDVLGNPVEYQYLDLSVLKDDEFGSKCPIVLPDNTTRSFAVRVTRVFFDDGNEWNGEETLWSSLPALQLLEDRLQDKELAKEYRLALGEDCKYYPQQIRDLWGCTCGTLNHQSEKRCSHCHRVYDALAAVSWNNLAEKARVRLRLEAEAAETARIEEEKQAAKRRTRRKKIAKIACGIFVVILVVSAVVAWVTTEHIRVKEKAKKYADAGDYMTAVETLDAFTKPEQVKIDRERYLALMEDEIQLAISDKDYAAAVALINKYTVLDSSKKNLALIQKRCGHPDWTAERVESTCTEDGYDGKSCTVCGHVEGTIFKATGHDYISEILSEATCTECGSATLTCRVCGESHSEELEMLPHDYQTTTTKKATCTEAGEALNTCAMCGESETETIPAAGHKNVEKVLQAVTCTADGSKQTVCSVCGNASEAVKIPSNGHAWVDATCKAPKTCTGCGATEGVALGHEWNMFPTYSGGPYCKRCNEKYPLSVTLSVGMPFSLKQRDGVTARFDRMTYSLWDNKGVTTLSIYVYGYSEKTQRYSFYDVYLKDNNTGQIISEGNYFIIDEWRDIKASMHFKNVPKTGSFTVCGFELNWEL